MKQVYVYRYRPEYKGSNLLIEFFRGAEQDNFLNDVLEVLSDVHPHVESVVDLWMNDELWLKLTTDVGEFELSSDIWGFVFITGKANQDGLKQLELMFSKNEKFLREDVNYEDYV